MRTPLTCVWLAAKTAKTPREAFRVCQFPQKALGQLTNKPRSGSEVTATLNTALCFEQRVATQEKPADLLGSQAGLGAAVAAETHQELGEVQAVRARGYWEQVWRRLRRDTIAIASAIFIVLLVAAAFGGSRLAENVVGHGPNHIFVGTKAITPDLNPNPDLFLKVTDPITLKDTTLVLGASDRLGRDELLRILNGAKVSLEVAVLSTLFVMLIGVLLGATAGYYRGFIDTIISRLTEITMAFPALLFIIALAATVGPRLDKITLGIFAPGVITLVLVFSIFGWFYPARIMRAQVLSIREKEYIEAARMVGAGDWRIIRSHVLPHLVAPMIVYSTLIVAQFVLAEAGLSFLGLGIKSPTASWGNMLADSVEFYTVVPWLMLWPGLAVLLTTLAFNLLGDGLRDAFDPRSSH
jgi:peptide/nickel transport system permease protein